MCISLSIFLRPNRIIIHLIHPIQDSNINGQDNESVKSREAFSARTFYYKTKKKKDDNGENLLIEPDKLA